MSASHAVDGSSIAAGSGGRDVASPNREGLIGTMALTRRKSPFSRVLDLEGLHVAHGPLQTRAHRETAKIEAVWGGAGRSRPVGSCEYGRTQGATAIANGSNFR